MENSEAIRGTVADLYWVAPALYLENPCAYNDTSLPMEKEKTKTTKAVDNIENF